MVLSGLATERMGDFRSLCIEKNIDGNGGIDADAAAATAAARA